MVAAFNLNDYPAPLLDAEARLHLLRTALMDVKATKMDGSVLIYDHQWNAVLEALAASMHQNIALDLVIKDTVAKTVKNISNEFKSVSTAKKSKVPSLDSIYEEDEKYTSLYDSHFYTDTDYLDDFNKNNPL